MWQKTLTQISDITYEKEQKNTPSCSIIIYRLNLTEVSGDRWHATVEILSLKRDSKIQKFVEYNFHHNVIHLLKVFVQGFYKGGANTDSMHVAKRRSKYWSYACRTMQNFFTEVSYCIHHELMYLSTSMFLTLNFRMLFSKPNPRN